MNTTLLERPMLDRPAAERPLVLPFTGQALRQAVAHSDIAALMDFAHQLRVAGYRVSPQVLVTELLTHGCTWLVDSFGHRVPLQVQVPARHSRQAPDEQVSFRISA